MLHRELAASRRACWVLLAVIAVAAVFCSPANGQLVNQAVGGVSIDTKGILSTARPDLMGELGKVRVGEMQQVPEALNAAVPMRKVSLRRLAATLDDCARNKKPIPDSAKYLAGLQRIRYVFVYPEQKDIVLVGPGEGWTVDPNGNVVGATNGRPVMLLDDLLVALRTAKAAAQGGITCSINPTPEGLARYSQLPPDRSNDPRHVASRIEEALGMQQISVTGVPDSSHFARVLVAADYQMKRIGMNLDRSPIRELPSYLQMLPAATRAASSPRFWLEPRYDALLRDADGLAYEFRGLGVKALTEEDWQAANGNRQRGAKPGRIAQRWADLMTANYQQLAAARPIFGELQNCMDLAVVSALIVKERLPEKAGDSLNGLLDATVKVETFNAPKQVKSIASVLDKGRHPVIGVSGGVAINSWIIADQVKTSDTVAPVRAKAAPAQNANWWWN
ncbi:MAG: DUF1598 domain-containing protein [Thermoguttaceae bacterium]